MAMNFFESQDAARRSTGRLVFLFVLAVLAITAMLFGLAVFISAYYYGRHEDAPIDWSVAGDPRLIGGVFLATFAIIGLGSLYKIVQLRAGGSAIAERLGGWRIAPGATDPIGRKILNVVEEMAIASGTPTPPVYLLKDEGGINAFAAGYSPDDAVIGVTRGCVERLSRDELQGVIAHEFSHIINGDMRLNIRLIGVLHGILVIGIIGFFLLRSAFFAGGRSSRRRSGGDQGGMPLLAIGVAMMAIGFIGTFFGNLIKAAVSRQREYLADASAVQFTRNPDGIGGALKRIGGSTLGSGVGNPNANEVSHMFFSRAIVSGLSALFSTHPPLLLRIKRIDPSWDGDFTKFAGVGKTTAAAAVAGVAGLAGGAQAKRAKPRRKAKARSTPTSAIDQIGRPTTAHIEYAATLVASLPDPVTAAAREAYGARAVIYALLINKDTEARRAQLDRLDQHADKGVRREVGKLLPLVERLDAKARLPLVDMAIPSLRTLTPKQYHAFRSNVTELIEADRKIDLFEWTLQRILLHHLDPQFVRVQPARVRHNNLARLRGPCEVLLSTLASAGHRDRQAAQHAFDQAAGRLNVSGLSLRAGGACGLAELDKALDVLTGVAPRAKRRLLEACAVCISADKEVTVAEAELFRAIADSLGCPTPPLLPGQPLA